MTKVYSTGNPDETELGKLKAKLVKYIRQNEGCTNEEIAEANGIDQAFTDALLAELSNEGKVRLYI